MHAAAAPPNNTGPLDWVVEKETRNLEVLHGQSDLSSWYFIESAQIGGININVTVSLSSRLLASAGRGGGGMGLAKVRTAALGLRLVPVARRGCMGEWLHPPACPLMSLPPCSAPHPAAGPTTAVQQPRGRLQPRPGHQRLHAGQRRQRAHQPGPLDGGQRPRHQQVREEAGAELKGAGCRA